MNASGATYPVECLDFVEILNRDRVYPCMQCRMRVEGTLSVERLKNAVMLLSEVVPETLCSIDLASRCFVDRGMTSDDAVIVCGDEIGDKVLRDLEEAPQLRVFVHLRPDGSDLLVVMSHVLADGAGLLQCLHLLARAYSVGTLDSSLTNQRDVGPLLSGAKVSRPTEAERRVAKERCPCVRPMSHGGAAFSEVVRINRDDLRLIRSAAHREGVSMNDALMTAYARAVARTVGQSLVVLSCPADLRRFRDGANAAQLTVANMTGTFKRVAVNGTESVPFADAVAAVNREMRLQKDGARCFSGVKELHTLYSILPAKLLGAVVRRVYRINPVSYTNIGRIDRELLAFDGLRVEDCYLTGTYRIPPDFQLSVSTFDGVCTLNCTLVGSDEDRVRSRMILERVKGELVQWAAASAE